MGARSESRAIASTTAPTSTARPASCPPIRRESSGTVAAASATRMVLCGFFAGGSPMGSVLGVVVGPTVGNRPDGSPGDVPVPESGGSVTGGSAMPVAGSVADVVGEVAGFVTTTSVAESVKDSDLLAVALALSWTCSPLAASCPTRTLT